MFAKFLTLLLLGLVCGAWGEASTANQDANRSDLATAETSAKLLNLGSLFGQGTGYPNYGYNYPSYGYNNNNNNGYYNRPNTGYYPKPGYYYPSNNYYPSTGGSYYPSTGSGYYPSTGNGYYPTTNILGTTGYGGYGGYGGNGGLRQYSGYWQPDYSGHRNRGYGYYRQTDRYGLPRDYNQRDHSNHGSYRGYD